MVVLVTLYGPAAAAARYFAFCDQVAGRYLHHAPHYEEAHAFHKPGALAS